MSNGPGISDLRIPALLAYWAIGAITIFFEPLRHLALECWRVAVLAPLRAVREGWGGLTRRQWAPDRHEARRRSLAAARGI